MIGQKISTYEALVKEVTDLGGVSTIKMHKLRDIHGADRLGVNVLSNIKEKLAGLGLGHLPINLPNNQNETALIYKKGQVLAQIIECLTEISEDSDHKLQKLIGNDKANTTIKKIRELVCDD